MGETMVKTWNMKSLKGTSAWPKRTIRVTNPHPRLTPRQNRFAAGTVKAVNKTLNVKNK